MRTPGRRSQQAEPSTESGTIPTFASAAAGPEESLWRRHLYMGVFSFLLGGLLLLAYLAATPHGPHRGALIVVDVVAVVVWLGVAWPLGARLLQTRWQELFFFLWSVATVVVIAVPVGIDGGAESPLSVLLVLPVLFAGLLYRLRAVLGLAVIALVSFGLIFLVGPSASGARALVTAVMIGIAGVIAASAAANRRIWEQERLVLTARLHDLATHDGLTGSLNYQSFQDALAAECDRARRYERPFSVLLADLDDLKGINDRYGHAVGDATLTAVVDAMEGAVRSTDLVGRLGGDEFAVLFAETSIDLVHEAVGRIQSLIRQASTERPVTLSFGISSWQLRGDSPESLLERADQALYDAKRSGRNTAAYRTGPDEPERRQGSPT